MINSRRFETYTVAGAAVVEGQYVYAMRDFTTGVVGNVVDHLPREVRNYDRDQFRNTLTAINRLDNALLVMTETTFKAMGDLLKRYRGLDHIMVIDRDNNVNIHSYDGSIYWSGLSTQLNGDVSWDALEADEAIPAWAKNVVVMGGARLFDALPTSNVIISEYDPPVGQRHKFINNGLVMKPLRKFKQGTTISRCEFGNWHGRTMILSDNYTGSMRNER